MNKNKVPKPNKRDAMIAAENSLINDVFDGITENALVAINPDNKSRKAMMGKSD